MSILSDNLDYSAIVGETYLVSVRVEPRELSESFSDSLLEKYKWVAGQTRRSKIDDILSTLLYDKLVSAPNAYLDDVGLNTLFQEFGGFMFTETTDEKNDYRTREYGQRTFSSGKSVYITLTPRENVSFERRS